MDSILEGVRKRKRSTFTERGRTRKYDRKYGRNVNISRMLPRIRMRSRLGLKRLFLRLKMRENVNLKNFYTLVWRGQEYRFATTFLAFKEIHRLLTGKQSYFCEFPIRRKTKKKNHRLKETQKKISDWNKTSKSSFCDASIINASIVSKFKPAFDKFYNDNKNAFSAFFYT